jgi:Mg-chelatase subunit ChlI
VDVLLDVAVSGVNVVMREGVTYSHPSRFLLVGTMNPEEGELRPQLLDRFGLCVEVSGEKELGRRRQIVERVLAFERDDPAFRARWAKEDAALRERLVMARKLLPSIEVSDHVLGAVVEVVADLGVAGHRGDITILKCAKALAAVKGTAIPDEECLADAFRLSLPHRMKEDPFDEAASGKRRLDAVLSRFGVQPQRTVARPGPTSEV